MGASAEPLAPGEPSGRRSRRPRGVPLITSGLCARDAEVTVCDHA
ncbi:hypothetical protein ACFYNM_04650 [Streptomyces spororaveus]